MRAQLAGIVLLCAGSVQAAAVDLKETTPAGAKGKSFVATTVIDEPMAKLCALIQDYADYPAFMPNTDSVKVTQAAPTQIDVTLKLPMGKVKKYRLRMEPKTSAEACVLAWKLVPWPGLKQEETIADTSGQWKLTPVPGNPGQTAVKYTLFTDPGPIPFGLGWIVDSMSKDSIPATLEGLRTRAAKKP